MKPVQLAPEAVTELAEAATWYESREPGLGDRFLEEVGGVLPTLGTRPRSFPRLQDPAPDLDIRVLAVAHAKRRPAYWLHRVRS
jgi:hypothetical protein